MNDRASASIFVMANQGMIKGWSRPEPLRLDVTPLRPMARHNAIRLLEAQGHRAELWWSPRRSSWTIRVHITPGK